MGRLLGCIGCFFQGTDHLLSQGEEWEGFLGCSGSYPHPIRERNRKAPGLHLEGRRSYPHPIRERNGKVSLAAAGHILTQLGRGMGRLQRLLFPEHRSYPHPIRERNGKVFWLHRLLFHGHRSYPHPIRERNGKAPWLHRLLFQIISSPNAGEEWEGFLAASAAFSRAQIISSLNYKEEWEGSLAASAALSRTQIISSPN